jgi:TatD DNase family protein
MPRFFDTHAHLDYPEFAADLPQILTRAAESGVERIIAVGTDSESSRRAVVLANTHPGIFAAVGWHPSHADQAPEEVRPILEDLARQPRVVAIGEIGLDYHRLPRHEDGTETDAAIRTREIQRRLMRQQLEVAAGLGLNCVVHQRDSMEDTLALMREVQGRTRGVFHCFVDRPDLMREVLSLGGLVSFTGIVTFKSGAPVRETVAATPMNRFMVETDCPYLAPVPFRGKRCEPAYVRLVAEEIARVKACSLESLSTATCATAEEFFRF